MTNHHSIHPAARAAGVADQHERAPAGWRRALDAELATRWAPSDLDRLLGELADDPAVTDAASPKPQSTRRCSTTPG